MTRSQFERPDDTIQSGKQDTISFCIIDDGVGADARLGAGVMMTNYVDERDLEMREKSNRTFQRIAASLPPHVAHRYGHQTRTERSIEGQLKEAVESQNWDLVRTLSAKLAERDRQAG